MAKDKTHIFIGSQKPISEIPFGRQGRQICITEDIVKTIKQLPLGYMQETTLSTTGAWNLLSRLERGKIIEPSTYRVRVIKKVVFIVHETVEPPTPERTAG